MFNFKNLPNFDTFTKSANESIDKLTNVSETSFEKIEKVSALNLGMTHEVVESSLKSARSILSVKSPKELFEIISSNSKDASVRFTSYCKSLQETLLTK